MGRQSHTDRGASGRYCAGQNPPPEVHANPMQYLPLFLLLAAVLIAGWFYLQRAKTRDTDVSTVSTTAPADPAVTDRPAE
jgi:hypothetical protein